MTSECHVYEDQSNALRTLSDDRLNFLIVVIEDISHANSKVPPDFQVRTRREDRDQLRVERQTKINRNDAVKQTASFDLFARPFDIHN